MFAGTHYRFEPIVSEEPNFLFENSNYASSWQICWAGVMGQDYIDALAEIGNTFMESEGFRDLLAVSFVKTPFQNSEKEDLDSNQIAPKPNVTLATFEIDPVRLLLSRLEKANLEGIRNDTTKYWSDNAIRAMQGSKPLTWSEFRKEIKKKKGHKNTDRG